jgi:hypothetical protein
MTPKRVNRTSGSCRIAFFRRQFCQAGSEQAAGTRECGGYSDALDGKWRISMSEVCATISSISNSSSDALFRYHCIPPLETFANSVSNIGTFLLPIGGIFRNFGPAHTVCGGTLGNGFLGSPSTSGPGAETFGRTLAGVEMNHSRKASKDLQCAETGMAMKRLVDTALFVDMPASSISSRLNQYYAATIAANEV